MSSKISEHLFAPYVEGQDLTFVSNINTILTRDTGKIDYSNEVTAAFAHRGEWNSFVITLAQSHTREQPTSSDHLAEIFRQHYWDMHRSQIDGLRLDPGLDYMLYDTLSDIQFFELAEMEAWDFYRLYRGGVVLDAMGKNALMLEGDF